MSTATLVKRPNTISITDYSMHHTPLESMFTGDIRYSASTCDAMVRLAVSFYVHQWLIDLLF